MGELYQEQASLSATSKAYQTHSALAGGTWVMAIIDSPGSSELTTKFDLAELE